MILFSSILGILKVLLDCAKCAVCEIFGWKIAWLLVKEVLFIVLILLLKNYISFFFENIDEVMNISNVYVIRLFIWNNLDPLVLWEK